MESFLLYFVPLIEIGIITVILNYLLSFFWNTRAMDLVLGFLAFLSMFAIANVLHLPVLQKLLFYIGNAAVIAVLVIFQPELRLALMRLSLIKGRTYREITEFDKFLDSIATSVFRLADKKIGALILLENQNSLKEYANNAVILNAEFSSELLESLFMTTTPLHDGAVIISGTSIVSAATILPLADDSSQLAKSMGTRHRAGLGISQLTDALIIVISEESGKVSIAREGVMTPGVKIDRFMGIIRSIFNPPKIKLKNRFNISKLLNFDFLKK